jgi:hypothetical protein
MRCPRCARFVTRGASSCERCQLFCCASCRRWVPWDVGGADASPASCARCWGAQFRLRRRELARVAARLRARIHQPEETPR